eukprot:6462235-Amphidinium_carterae.7
MSVSLCVGGCVLCEADVKPVVGKSKRAESSADDVKSQHSVPTADGEEVGEPAAKKPRVLGGDENWFDPKLITGWHRASTMWHKRIKVAVTEAITSAREAIASARPRLADCKNEVAILLGRLVTLELVQGKGRVDDDAEALRSHVFTYANQQMSIARLGEEALILGECQDPYLNKMPCIPPGP